jgi:hypothetical protein
MRSPAFVLALLVAGSALAQSDLPRRKSGLWLITISGGPDPAMQFHECVDRDKDDFMRGDPGNTADPECSKNEIRRQGGSVILESVCKEEGSTATTRAVFTGNFDTAYKGESKTTYRPPLQGIGEMTQKTEGRWIATACKPGQKPGDMDRVRTPGGKGPK